MKLFDAMLVALVAASGGITTPSFAQADFAPLQCWAMSVRGGPFSCPGCTTPGAMPLQCAIHKCDSPAPAVEGWILFRGGFPDFSAAAAAQAMCLGTPAATATTPPVAVAPPVPAPMPAPPVVTSRVPPPPVIIRRGPRPPVIIQTRPRHPRVFTGPRHPRVFVGHPRRFAGPGPRHRRR